MAVPTTTIDPGLIVVTVGVDSSPDRIAQVPVGTPITLTITNPDADDEFHIHGLDLGSGEEVPRGQPKTFRFTLNNPGDYEVESHRSDDVLVVIRAV
jgi:hypothetical protein